MTQTLDHDAAGDVLSATASEIRHRDRDKVASKLSLLHASRLLEGALIPRIISSGGRPLVVALFQSAEYFDAEAARYGQLAKFADVVVGFEGAPAFLPEGVHHLALTEDHPLSEEWTVLALSDRGSAALVATDLHESATAASLERGRLFRHRMSCSHADVVDELNDICERAGALLPADTSALITAAVERARQHRPADAEQVLLGAFEGALESSVRLTEQLQRAEVHAETDPLTGAHNRRFLDAYLTRAGRRAPSMAVIAFDFDDFKGLNDRYGHAVGDVALRTFVDAVRSSSRQLDVLVRLGGDEFVRLMPNMGLARASGRAEEIIDKVRAARIGTSDATLSCSAGVGVYPANSVDLHEVDLALYREKATAAGTVATTCAAAPTPNLA